MYTCEFYISQDFICVIISIVFDFRQTQPHAFNKLLAIKYVIVNNILINCFCTA